MSYSRSAIVFASDFYSRSGLVCTKRTKKDDNALDVICNHVLLALETEKVNNLESFKETIGKYPSMLSGLGSIMYKCSPERFEDMQQKMAIDGAIEKIRIV